MHILKRVFSYVTGYWIHKISSLPVGANLFIDIHKRMNYGPLTTMFDVGANIGQTCEWFRYNEGNAKIYCFEPVAETYRQLKNKAGDDKNCVFENIAFGEVPGEKCIKVYDEYSFLNSLKEELMNQDSNAREEIIKIDTVDNYCSIKGITKIDLLKIDTEGYELNVLTGAKQMLSNASISFIYCEVGFLKREKRHTNFGDLTEWLAEKNYHFVGLYELSLHAWKQNSYFGNALYVYKDIYK